MYPPQKVTDVKELFGNLCASLQRGGLEMYDELLIDKDDTKKEWNVYLRMLVGIPKSGWPHLQNYIKSYAKASGWKVKVKQKRLTLIFTAQIM